MMGFGPHAADALEIVALVEAGIIFRDPRPPTGPGLRIIRDMAEVRHYIHASPGVPEGKRWDWRELLDAGGEPHDQGRIDRADELLDAVTGLLEWVGKLSDGRISPSLDEQLGDRYTEQDITWVWGTLDFILFHRATSGRSLPFVERLVEIYRRGGHPCGWVGAFPEGELVAYFPAADGCSGS